MKPHRFVDMQLSGPYTLWHHTHTFEERDGGTLCLDEVRYRPRGGALVNWLFVRRDVERIFKFRADRLEEILGVAATVRTSQSNYNARLVRRELEMIRPNHTRT